MIVRSIIKKLRGQGRNFMEKQSDGLWYEANKDKIRRKVVQACREGAPEIRAVTDSTLR